jgi:hypothetical protein
MFVEGLRSFFLKICIEDFDDISFHFFIRSKLKSGSSSLMSLSFENSEHLGTVFVAVPMSQNLTLHFNKCLRACLSEKTAVHLGQAISDEEPDFNFDLMKKWKDMSSKSCNDLEDEDIEAYFDASSDIDDFSEL